jgi:predicted phosphodiesterase
MYEDSPNLEVIVAETDADIIVCGHTHIPFHRIVGGKHFINAGSVGKPKHGNSNATYIIVDIVNHKITIDIVEVSYDVEKTAKAVEQSIMFDRKLSEMLRKGY